VYYFLCNGSYLNISVLWNLRVDRVWHPKKWNKPIKCMT